MIQEQYQVENLDCEILAIVPIQELHEMMILTESGILYKFDLDQQILTQITKLHLVTIQKFEKGYFPQSHYELHNSSNGLYSAVVINYGQFGQIICNQTGEVLLHLDAQNYHADTVPFSIAFTQFENDDIVIYRSDWNKLDTFNLTQRSSSTDRHIAPYENERPEHYLDYFHGALYISPNGQYILDDGWIWHPIAVPKIWSLPTWLSLNPFESEDGTSVQQLCYRDNWNDPISWLDDTQIAIWNIELWDSEEFDLKPEPKNRSGIHILSVEQTMWDEDYVPNYWKMPKQTQKVFNLYVDQNLFIVVGNENISVYHFSERVLINQIKNSRPQKQHKIRQSLLSFENKTVYEVNYL